MKIRVNQPVIIDRTYLPVGVQTVPDAYAKHWYFKALLSEKKIELFEVAKPAVAAKPAPKPAAPVKPPATAKPTVAAPKEAPQKDA